jgi:hypothetical protein
MTNHSKQTLDSVDAAAALEEQAVLAPIQALVDSVAKRDKKAMLDVLLPDGGTTVVMNGKVLQFSLRGLMSPATLVAAFGCIGQSTSSGLEPVWTAECLAKPVYARQDWVMKVHNGTTKTLDS